jgi:hypothetical protein
MVRAGLERYDGVGARRVAQMITGGASPVCPQAGRPDAP